jgi:hypothetical protein
MKFECAVKFVHVAGTRMIEQGTDGLSRGDMLEGVMRGDGMLKHVPLHLDALERFPPLRDWIGSWASNPASESIEYLSPADWFERGHDISGFTQNLDGVTIPTYSKGVMVWSPPPAAARFAMEELRQARHKRQASTHIFIVPKLMTPEWMKQTFKAADLCFQIPAGHPMWPAGMHEPLTIAILFPYLSRAPWQLKGSNFVGGMERTLYRVCRDCPSSTGSFLSELFKLERGMDTLSKSDLRKLLCRREAIAVPNQ